MTFWPFRQLANQVRSIPLESVLQSSGARPDSHDKHRWHTPQGVISVTGAKFMNWTCGQGGGGAIDLAMHLHGLGFQQAVQWLSQRFAWPATADPTPVAPKPALSLPIPDPTKLWRVEQYLIGERHIPSALVHSLVQSANLYADHRANAVFLQLGEQSAPVGAELRGTTSRPWHGLAPGSQKDYGFFSIPTAPLKTIILVESAIDAISCLALHPQHRCISTAGARPNPRWLPALLDKGYSVYCGFDADTTGETMARAMIALYPRIQRLRPSQHDWNDVLKARA
jgi:DNA primase